MRDYYFEVIIGERKCGGQIIIFANNKADAIDKANQYVGNKLYEAFPELDIEYGVNCISEIKDEESLTKEEAVRRHRELWNKIAEMIKENGGDTYDWDVEDVKRHALKELGYNEAISNKCWCCEYEKQNRLHDHVCKNCPIRWHGQYCYNDSEYEDFGCALDANDDDEAYRIARVIANLPEVE